MNSIKRFFVQFVKLFCKSEKILKWIIFKKSSHYRDLNSCQLWKMSMLTKLNLNLGKQDNTAGKERLHFGGSRKSVRSVKFWSKAIRISGNSDLEKGLEKLPN